MLGKKVSTSRRLASLSSDSARLLWSWALAHADRDGCVPGDPDVLRAVVVPMLGWSTEQAASALAELVGAGLVTMREAGGSRCAQFSRFAEGQAGFRYDREAPSKWANSGPTPAIAGPTPEDSGPTPTTVGPKQSKAKQMQSKGSTNKARATPEQVRLVFDAWREETDHPGAKLDKKRTARIKARLAEGFTPERLVNAIQGRRYDSWLMGQGKSPRVFDDIDTLLRDASQVERLEHLYRDKPARRPAHNPIEERYQAQKARVAMLEAQERKALP
jgi:hypothetical protein